MEHAFIKGEIVFFFYAYYFCQNLFTDIMEEIFDIP